MKRVVWARFDANRLREERRNERIRRIKMAQAIIARIAKNALGENADIELARSMIVRRFNADEEPLFTATLARRARLADDYGLPVSVFRDVSFDCTLADEIALLESYRQKGESDAGSGTGALHLRSPTGGFA